MKNNKRTIMLQNIFSHFQQVTQWMPNEMGFANDHIIKAEALIEYLEVEDCGSVGGYDSHSPVKIESGFKLYDRFLALVRKENTKIKKECYFTIDDMKKYFKILKELRETFNN